MAARRSFASLASGAERFTVAELFAGERNALEGQRSRGDTVDTEAPRAALRRYRPAFGSHENACRPNAC